MPPVLGLSYDRDAVSDSKSGRLSARVTAAAWIERELTVMPEAAVMVKLEIGMLALGSRVWSKVRVSVAPSATAESSIGAVSVRLSAVLLKSPTVIPSARVKGEDAGSVYVIVAATPSRSDADNVSSSLVAETLTWLIAGFPSSRLKAAAAGVTAVSSCSVNVRVSRSLTAMTDSINGRTVSLVTGTATNAATVRVSPGRFNLIWSLAR